MSKRKGASDEAVGQEGALEKGEKKPLPQRDVQSMGWLTESSQQPKRHRFIEGEAFIFLV